MSNTAGGRPMNAELVGEHNPICILNAYAPQSHRPAEDTCDFYDKLTETLNNTFDDDNRIVPFNSALPNPSLTSSLFDSPSPSTFFSCPGSFFRS